MALVIMDFPVPLKVDSAGIVRVGDTRVTLDSIVAAYLNGSSAEQIAEDFSTLDLADIHTVIAYFLRHTDDVGRYLEEQRQAAKGVQRDIHTVVAPGGIRQRLMARLQRKDLNDASLGN